MMRGLSWSLVLAFALLEFANSLRSAISRGGMVSARPSPACQQHLCSGTRLSARATRETEGEEETSPEDDLFNNSRELGELNINELVGRTNSARDKQELREKRERAATKQEGISKRKDKEYAAYWDRLMQETELKETRIDDKLRSKNVLGAPAGSGASDGNEQSDKPQPSLEGLQSDVAPITADSFLKTGASATFLIVSVVAAQLLGH
ncbi:hypothetical protein B484DRAFT_169367 [Ochromonadaceae sp. CCMP2298]|nr:hypothetical protein B484DRAFT_169367 [Ochromonadaceae sp. CCMP2298]